MAEKSYSRSQLLDMVGKILETDIHYRLRLILEQVVANPEILDKDITQEKIMCAIKLNYEGLTAEKKAIFNADY